jgi:hypothetical protein
MRDDSAVAAAIRARGFKYLGRQCYIRPYRVPVREGRPPLPANVAQPASVDPFPSRPAGGDGDPVPVPAPASQVDDAAAGRPTVIPYGKFAGVLIATLCNDDLVQARRELARVYPGAQGAIMSEISRRQNAARNREAARAGRQRRSPRRW